MPLTIEYGDDSATAAIGLASGLAQMNQREMDRQNAQNDRMQFAKFSADLTSRRDLADYEGRKRIDRTMQDQDVAKNKAEWDAVKQHFMGSLTPEMLASPDVQAGLATLDSGAVHYSKVLPGAVNTAQDNLRLMQQEKDRAAYQTESNRIKVEGQRDKTAQGWERIGQGATKLTNDLTVGMGRVGAAMAAATRPRVGGTATQPTLEQKVKLDQLKSRLADLRRQKIEAGKSLAPDARAIAAIDAQIAETEQQQREVVSPPPQRDANAPAPTGIEIKPGDPDDSPGHRALGMVLLRSASGPVAVKKQRLSEAVMEFARQHPEITDDKAVLRGVADMLAGSQGS